MRLLKIDFQFVSCWRNRRNIYLDEEISKRDNEIASLLCGSAFYLYPDQAIFSHTAITIVEIYWTLYYEQIKSYVKWIPLDKIKMIYVFFPIAFGYVTHVRVFYPWLAPAILKKLMHLTTNYKYVLHDSFANSIYKFHSKKPIIVCLFLQGWIDHHKLP